MFCQLFWFVNRVGIFSRENHICTDVISILPHFASELHSKTPTKVFLENIPGIRNFAGKSASSHHSRAGKVDTCIGLSHPTFKIAVGRGYAHFSWRQNTHVVTHA